MSVGERIRDARLGMGTAVALVVVERTAWLVEPTVFGDVIDEVIARPHHPERLVVGLPFALWLGVFLANTAAGATRRYAEARVYPTLHGRLAVDVVTAGTRAGEDASRIAARAELAREFVEFFQKRVPDFIGQGFNTLGTLVALVFYDWRISVACAAIAMPVLAIQRVYERRVATTQRELHDTQEGVFSAFAGGDAESVRAHYAKVAAAEVRIARYGGVNFALLRVLLLAVFVLVLYVAVDLDQDTTGDLYSIVTYLWTFIGSAEDLPDLLQSVGAFRDIARRLPRD